MRYLMEVARDQGLEIIEGQVLSANKRMLELMDSLGFETSMDPDDSSIKHVVAQLHQ